MIMITVLEGTSKILRLYPKGLVDVSLWSQLKEDYKG